MRAAAQMTLTTSGLIIGIAAVGLVRVIFHLRAIHANLAGTTGAVETVADLTSSVPGRLTSINASLKPVREFCDSV